MQSGKASYGQYFLFLLGVLGLALLLYLGSWRSGIVSPAELQLGGGIAPMPASGERFGAIEGRLVTRDPAIALEGISLLASGSEHSKSGHAAVSSASGEFRFTDLPVGEYRVSVGEDTGLCNDSAPQVVVLLGETKNLGTMEVFRCTPRGRVESAATRTPVKGATLRLSRLGSNEVLEVVTDNEGIFTLPVDAQGMYGVQWLTSIQSFRNGIDGLVRVSLTGETPMELKPGPEPRPFTVPLVSGTVLKTSGDAWPHAQVNFAASRDWMGLLTTDEAGNFVLPGIAPVEQLVLGASSENLQGRQRTLRVPAEGLEGVVLTLDEGSTISGVVTDEAGEVLEGVRVRASGDLRSSTTIETGSDGTFAFANLLPARYEIGPLLAGALRVRHEDTLEVELLPGASVEGVHLVLPSVGGTIAGVVLRPDGSPLEAAEVFCDARLPNTISDGGVAYADSAGQFLITGLLYPSYHVRVTHPKFTSWAQRGEVDGPELEIVLEAPGSLLVVVLEASTRDPVQDVKVAVLEGLQTQFEPWMLTWPSKNSWDRSGRVSFSTLDAGESTLYVSAPGYEHLLEPVWLESGEDKRLTLLLEKPSCTSGLVTTASGTPVANAAIFPRSLPSDFARERLMLGRSGADGVFCVVIPPGTALISAYHEF